MLKIKNFLDIYIDINMKKSIICHLWLIWAKSTLISTGDLHQIYRPWHLNMNKPSSSEDADKPQVADNSRQILRRTDRHMDWVKQAFVRHGNHVKAHWLIDWFSVVWSPNEIFSHVETYLMRVKAYPRFTCCNTGYRYDGYATLKRTNVLESAWCIQTANADFDTLHTYTLYIHCIYQYMNYVFFYRKSSFFTDYAEIFF